MSSRLFGRIGFPPFSRCFDDLSHPSLRIGPPAAGRDCLNMHPSVYAINFVMALLIQSAWAAVQLFVLVGRLLPLKKGRSGETGSTAVSGARFNTNVRKTRCQNAASSTSGRKTKHQDLTGPDRPPLVMKKATARAREDYPAVALARVFVANPARRQ